MTDYYYYLIVVFVRRYRALFVRRASANGLSRRETRPTAATDGRPGHGKESDTIYTATIHSVARVSVPTFRFSGKAILAEILSRAAR